MELAIIDGEKEKQKNEEEIMQQLLKLLTDAKLEPLKELINKNFKYKFIIPLRRSNNKNIEQLYKNDYKELPKESINLLNQSYRTIKNVHRLIKNKSLVDSNTLTRSAFENLIMGMMIYFDSNVYTEFKQLGLKDEERTYTKQQKLRNMFRKKLKDIDKIMFEDISNRQIQKMLDEYYDKLCLFTHSTLIVNEMVEVHLNDDEDFFLIISKQNIYFLEILLNCCLRYITKDKNDSIRYDYLFVIWMISISNIDKEKYTPEYLSKYNKLLYEDINKEYLDKNNKDIKLLQKEMQKLEEIIKNNPVAVIELLKNILYK